MSRIVQLTNAVGPASGSLSTVLDHLAAGYAAAGHEVVRIVPGPVDAVRSSPWGSTIELAAPLLPGTGCRVLTDLRRVRRELRASSPDRVEVHDRTTLRGVGRLARELGVPSVAVSHERLDRWLRQWLSPRLPLDRIADRSNTALARAFDHVVCTTQWAQREFQRLDLPNVRHVPLGVDLDLPASTGPEADGVLHLVMTSRLCREQRPDLAVGAVLELRRRGLDVRLRVVGDGPLRRSLAQRSAGAPVELLGVLPDRATLAAELRAADIALVPGPGETCAVTALEAMACGTPVVANVHSALREVVVGAGAVSASTPWSFADAVERLLEVPVLERRARARERAEAFTWSATVEGFLRTHELPITRRQPATTS